MASKNRFDNLALGVQKDLDLVKLAHRRGKTVPRFHVEQKSFNVIRCNLDLAETELEINVVRGIAYHVSKPKDIDTYVRIEFPFPQVSLALVFRNPQLTHSAFRKRLTATKPQSSTTQTIPNTMKNSLRKFSRKIETASESSNDTASSSKFGPRGKCPTSASRSSHVFVD